MSRPSASLAPQGINPMETCKHPPIEFGENERFGVFLRNTLRSWPNDPTGQARPKVHADLSLKLCCSIRTHSMPNSSLPVPLGKTRLDSGENQYFGPGPLVQGHQFRCNHRPDRRHGRRSVAFCLDPHDLLITFPSEPMKMWPISKRVRGMMTRICSSKPTSPRRRELNSFGE
jgi:hypothetical protein